MNARGLLVASVVVGAVACAKQDPAPTSQPTTTMASQSRVMGGGRGPMMGGGGPMGSGAGPHWHCPAGAGPLTEAARKALERALADERASEAKYEAIERTLGAVMPFRQVERAERRHAGAIERVFVAHGAVAPAATNNATNVAATNLREACAIGVQNEKQNIALYDELLEVDLPPDARCVFEHLQAASRERHLPTFERCAAKP